MKISMNRWRIFFSENVLSCIFISIVFFLSLTGCATQEIKETPLTSLSGGETGTISYESFNPRYLNDVLDGTDNEDTVTVFGVLKIPKNAKDKVPVIVLLHGGVGWTEKDERYLSTFDEMGIATFRLNSFKPRIVQGIIDNVHRVTPWMGTSDAYNALNLLSTHPRIDKDRIGIIGFSWGGMISLLSTWEPLRQSMVNGDLRFALHIAVYPICWQFEKLQMTGAPILILEGEKDDWVPAERCKEFTTDLKDAGYDVNLIIYENAHHSFDLTSKVKRINKSFSMTKCRYVVKSNGMLAETTSGLTIDSLELEKKAFEACTTPGPHAGLNVNAREKSLKDIKKFITNKFGL